MKRRLRWVGLVIRDGLLSVDFIAGVVTGGAFWLLADRYPEIAKLTEWFLIVLAPMSAGLAYYVSSQTSTFLSLVKGDAYERLLDRLGGIHEVLLPFRIATALAGSLFVYSVLASLLLPVASDFVQSILLGIGVGGFVWAAVGAFQVHGLVVFHGGQRHLLHVDIRKADDVLTQRRQERAPDGPPNESSA